MNSTKVIKQNQRQINIFRIQSDDSVMWRFCCITFIKYMIAGNNLLDYVDLPSPNEY